MPDALLTLSTAPPGSASRLSPAVRPRPRAGTRPTAHRRRMLARSLLDGTIRVGDVPRAARLLGLPERARYVVVAVHGGDVTERASCRDVVVPGDLVCRWHLGARADHGIVLLDAERGESTLDRLARSVEAAPSATSGPGPVRAGVGLPVEGLGGLDAARRHADAALALGPGAEPARRHQHLPAAMVEGSPDLAAALAIRVLGPLLRLPAPERDVLLDTLGAWLEGDGPALQTAERLGCHRNTVRNRLQRCERLTDRSLTRPADVVEVGLALRAVRLLQL